MYIVVLVYVSCRILFGKSLYKLHFLCYNRIMQWLSGYPARFQNKEVQNMENVKQKKIGLVLSGGGAKGAYEVGVWAALEQLGLTCGIDGIIGSSVGALNAVLFDTCDLQTAKDIWLNLKESDLLYVDQTAFFTLLLGPAFQAVRSTVWGIMLGGVFSQKRLEEIMKKNIDFRRSKRALYAVCSHIASPKLSEVFYLAEYAPDVRRKIVLASSALPVIYRGLFGARINGAGYLDGGISDNTPRMKLRAQGWRQTVTVWLTDQPEPDKLSNDRNIDIIPSESLGSFVSGTIKVDPDKQKHDFELGLRDTLALKERLLQMADAVK